MDVSIGEWSINYLSQQKAKILEQPKYQRGKVWSQLKDQLLIDSILRGIDLPKFYLRETKYGIYTYEIADGQQRINAILKFLNDEIKLSRNIYKGLNLSKIGSFEVGGKSFTELNKKLQDRFKKYKLTVAFVSNISNYDIRTLFGRLQMGDPLTPPEIRNAIISKLGDQIDLIVSEHDFFKVCKIRPERFKRQDYLSHCFALIHYKNKVDLKAPVLQKLYYDLSVELPREYIDTTIKILTCLTEIEKNSKRKIVNKWSFFDLFNFFLSRVDKIESIDYKKISTAFTEFEKQRIKVKNPEKLIEGKTPSDTERNLYNYIVSFKSNGGNPKNITLRLAAFEFFFEDKLN